MSKHAPEPISMFDRRIMGPALIESLKKLDPRILWRNPVMFAVEIASVITLVTFALSVTGAGKEPAWFTGLVSLWLWLTVVFATFSEALAEGRGKARAASLRKSRTEVTAKRLTRPAFGAPRRHPVSLVQRGERPHALLHRLELRHDGLIVAILQVAPAVVPDTERASSP